MTTKAELRHMDAVARLGCVVCRNLGYGFSPCEIHHVRMGNGMAQRAIHLDTIGLCPAHHRIGGHGVALHAGQRTWEAKFGTEAELLEQVRAAITQQQGSGV